MGNRWWSKANEIQTSWNYLAVAGSVTEYTGITKQEKRSGNLAWTKPGTYSPVIKLYSRCIRVWTAEPVYCIINGTAHRDKKRNYTVGAAPQGHARYCSISNLPGRITIAKAKSLEEQYFRILLPIRNVFSIFIIKRSIPKWTIGGLARDHRTCFIAERFTRDAQV